MASKETSKILINGKLKTEKNVGIKILKLLKLIKKPTKSKSYYLQYEGQLGLSNKPHGFGVVSKIYKNGFSEKYYNGTFVDGKKQGFGGLWTNNFYYEGDFFEDKKHGFGRIWYKNGSFYQGNWKDGSYHGDGMIIKDNGNRYQGKFIQGKKNGDGIFYHLKTGQMQKGYWNNNYCVRSTIEDIYWRQSALQPSPYPIPKLGELVRQDEVVVNLI